MKRLLRALALLYTSIATAMLGQGTNGGVIYASDFAIWTLPTGNSPIQGQVNWPNPDICKVSSQGRTFIGLKVGRPVTILDGSNTETVTPTQVVVNNNVCMFSATMAHQHYTYQIKSATAGLQEAIDYNATLSVGGVIVLTPMWASLGGTTAMITAATGNNGIYIIDQRTLPATNYLWNGSAYVASTVGTGTITGVTNGNGLTGGGTSGSVSLAVDSTKVPLLANNNVFTGTLAGTQIAGSFYAKQYGDGSTNGISTAAAAAGSNGLVVADPSYASTEIPTPTSFTAGPFHYQDQRIGRQVDLFYNPSSTILFNPGYYPTGGPTGSGSYCIVDQQAAYASAAHGYSCAQSGFQLNVPGFSYGNPSGFSGAGTGWLSTNVHGLASVVRGMGIAESLMIWQQKYGTGDNAPFYSYGWGEGGQITPSDEGNKGAAVQMNEDTSQFSATCNTGCTAGSTSIKTSVANGAQGVGRYLYDQTAGASYTGTITAMAAGLGSAEAYTVSATVPVSNAWGTISGAVSTPGNTTPPTFGTSMTFNVTVTSGTFDTTHLMCFAGNDHDMVIPTAVTNASGPTATITAVLRYPHSNATYVFQGGMCGQGLELTALTYNGLKYLFDVIGSTASNVIQAVAFNRGGSQTPGISGAIVQSFNISNTLKSIGTTVYGTYSGGALGGGHPSVYSGISIVIAGASDAALNTTCTGLTWLVTDSQFTCQIAGLTGTHTTTTSATASILNYNNFNTWPIAQVLDVQNESLSPPQVDGTLTLEPNVIPFATSDTVVESHHHNSSWSAVGALTQPQNPYATSTFGGTFSVQGKGAQGGSTSVSSNSVLSIGTTEPSSSYIGNGGYLTPMNGINIPGVYQYGITAGPPGLGAAFININASTTNRGTNWSLFSVQNRSGAFTMNTNPYYGDMTIGVSRILNLGGSANVLSNGLGATSFGDNITLAALGTPTTPTLTAKTSGGTLADATQYCYRYTITNSQGESLPSAEACVTTGSSGGNNSIQVDMTPKSGATGYKVYGRTTGAELLMKTNSGISTTLFTDDGSITPSGALPASDATLPGITGAKSIALNSSGTSFTNTVQAPASQAANATTTLCSTTCTVAPLASPTFTGTPAAPTPATGDNSTTIATTAFVKAQSYATTSQLPAVRAGTWSISAATSVAVTFSTAMGSAPTSCAITPSADPTTTGALWATSLATTGFTVNTHTSGTISGTYLCVINNAN